MSPWNPQANDIFLAALEITSPQEREAYVGEACSGQPQLAAQVHSLLAASNNAGSFLESLPSAIAVAVASHGATEDIRPLTEGPGSRIGPYKLLQQIGEGGFGVVYMAEQQQPVRRQVALKIIKPGMDTKEVIARFESERQALALMDHPNIAKVLDAAATESGRPYFVMELVKGIPVIQYCDENDLQVDDRLQLFIQVCHAVQHAHQKGIIHRDLKPSNVMVTMHDGRPVPKVIDFGVAKATGQQLTERTLFTAYGQMIGTPAYMSPEQAEMSGLDIDTRSDIYSLGVLLYELLTGTTPFDSQTLRAAGFDEMRRIIREVEPETVSARIARTRRVGQARAASAGPPNIERTNERRWAGAALVPLYAELDWIVMKSLDKDRERRYESTSAFAADVQRYLNDEAVQACPPSPLYRFRKVARRYKTALTTAALLLATLLLGAALSTWQAIVATAARNSESEARRALSAAKQLADDRANQMAKNLELLNTANRLVESGRSHADFGEWASAESELTQAIALRPENSRVWMERAQIYLRLGLWDLAAADFDEACKRQEPGSTASWYFQALLRLHVGDISGYRQACQQMQARFSDTTNPQSCDEIARACVLIAEPDVEADKLLNLAQRAIAGGKTPWRLADLGTTHYRAGQYEAAIERLRESQTMDPNWVKPWTNSILALAYHRLGQADQARQCLDTAASAIEQRVQNRDQNAPGFLPTPWWDILQSNLHYQEAKTLIDGAPPSADPRLWVIRGRALAALAREQEAVDSFTHAIWLQPALASAWMSRGRAHCRLDDWDKAVADYTQAYVSAPNNVSTQNNLAWLLVTCPDAKIRDPQRAVKLAKTAVELKPSDGRYWNTLGVALYRADDLPAAVTALVKSIEVQKGGDSIDWFFLAMARWRLQHPDEARQWFTYAAQRMEQQSPHDKELLRFRAEAAGLLKIADTSAAAPSTGPRYDVDFCTLVLQADPASAWAYDRRAWALVGLRQWQPAASDFSQLVELRPDDISAWRFYAQVLLQIGDLAGYRATCEKIWDRFHTVSDPYTTTAVCWTCILAPDAISDLPALVEHAQQYVASHPKTWHSLITVGAAHYRAGQWTEAIESMEQAIQLHAKGGNAYNWLILAMAHHRLGHADLAREWLAKAEHWLKQANQRKLDDPFVATPLPWRYGGQLEPLRHEAEQLILNQDVP